MKIYPAKEVKMDSKKLIAELREFISTEKERWKKHRDQCSFNQNSYAAYNGRVWMLGALQEKLKTISRRKNLRRARWIAGKLR